MRLLGFRTPIPEGYFRMLTPSSLQAPVLDAPVYDAPDTVVLDWSDLSTIEDGVHVYASYSEIDINALPPPAATLAPNTVQYGYAFDAGEPLEERLYFRVAAFKSGIVKASNETSIGNPANVLYPDSPTWLFGDEEYGFANTLGLDTLFTDTSGTTPVSAYGDAIALAVNLADDGPDMEQATGAERLVWGRMPVSGVRNICAQRDAGSENVGGAGWIRGNMGPPSASGTIAGFPANRMELTANTSPRNVRFAAAGVTGWGSFAVDVSEMITRQATVELGGAGRVTFTWSAGQTISISTSGDVADSYYEIVGDYQAILHTRCTAATTGNFALWVGTYGNYTSSGGEYFRATRAMLSEGATEQPYQKVVAPYDVTQSGIPSVNIAYADPSDDNWSWDLAAGTYHLFIAGEKGCYFDTVVHAGGEFTVGPTTWTGGPAGAITRLIGQRHVIMPVILDREFTQFEREQLVAYAMARGCPTLYTKSANLWTGENLTVGPGWTDNGDGTYTSVNTGTASVIFQPIAEEEIPANALYITDYTISRTLGSHCVEIVRPSIRVKTPDSTASGRMYRVSAMTSSHSIPPNRLMIRNASGTLSGTVSNVGFYRIDAIPLN